MGFHETQFPTDISYGSRGGPGWNTSIIELAGGGEEALSRWAAPRMGYDVAYGVKSPAQVSTLITFLRARHGAANGFRYKDFSDFTTGALGTGAPASTDQVIGAGDGSTTQFQLVKNYTNGSVTKIRTINKPVSGTVLVAKDGVNQASGWTVDLTTGIVTFTTAPAAAVVISAGCQFDVPVRLTRESDRQISIGIDAFDLNNFGAINLREIVSETVQPDEFYYGGAAQLDWTGVAQLSYESRVVLLNPTAAATLLMPATSTAAPGGPYFYLQNVSSFTVTCKQGATTVFSIVFNGHAVVLLTADKTWLGFT